jgi:uncharacterized protein (TIGR04255 family)
MAHYNRAPITEALIDIRVELSPEVRFDDLKAIAKHVSPEYPKEETSNLAEAIIQFGPSVQSSAQQKAWGLRFRNESDNQVLQTRLDGFAFSRLHPYQDFDHLKDEARRLWGIYRDLVRPKRITRTAVRYINQFSLPGERVEPADYFNTFPQVSDKLPPELRDFGPYLMNLRFHQLDLKGSLIFNQAMLPLRTAGTISIVLDFDLFVEAPSVSNEQELWSLFDRLRARKNLYYEACITNKARELIS